MQKILNFKTTTMGLFDKFTGGTPQIENEKEAFFAVIFAGTAADGEISEEEVQELVSILTKKQMFRNTDIRAIYNKTIKIFRSVGSAIGMIDIAAPKVSNEMKETLFATCVDIVLADGLVQAKEKEFVEKLKTALSISDEKAEKIVEVIIIKNKG